MKKALANKRIKYGVLGIVGAFFLFLLLNFLFPLPDQIDYSNLVLDNKGNVINASLTKDEKWRMKTELDEISPLLQKAIMAKEDRYFFYHPGINPVAIGRAAFMNLIRWKRTSGASTITMQVARALEPKRRTFLNKCGEVFRALQLEWKYDKQEILQLYLNLLPYGGNIEGVKAASLIYFRKNPDHLSLAEIMALSVIPNKPSSLVIGKTNGDIVLQRNKWLSMLERENVFSKAEIADALDEPLTASRNVVEVNVPHLARRLRKTATSHEVHSTIELNLQHKIEKLVKDYSRIQTLRSIRNAAVLIVDNKTRKVVAYVGSSDFYLREDGGQVDGITAVRQPGSTLKPLVYGLCIDNGLLTPKVIMNDVSVNYSGYTPENYDRKFNGFVTTEYALSHSLNIPAVNALKLVGKDKLVSTLADAGFKQIRKDQKKLGLSMILGGCGATLEELTALFAAFANGGSYQQLQYVQEPGRGIRKQILSPSAAFMITEILSKVDRPDFPLNWQSTERMPKIAWKTGTSYGRRDAWSIGYNKNYTVGVWLGNFSGKGAAELTGSNTATPLLFKIFNTIDYDTDEDWFSPPAECDIRRVCSETGMLPAAHCEHQVTDYFIPLISSTKLCDNQETVAISADQKYSYCKACQPETGYRKEVFRILSPDMQAYFDERRIAYRKIPPHNPTCEKIFQEDGPVISSPHNGFEYLISSKNPEPLMLACNTANDVSKVHWYINNQYYKSADRKSRQFFVPDEGRTKISCTDDKGRNRDIWINVRYIDL